ncbi:MAG: hypothetical protein CUN55_02655 [Phototrophicales bacterium]|nr:MAG: hypothetical protein CUN55_02655 [Phototrophicales bacterium]
MLKPIWRWLLGYRRALRVLLVYQCALLGIAALICLWRGRFTFNTWGHMLINLSILLIAFAVLSGIGALFSTQSFEYQFVSTISRDILDNQRQVAIEKQKAFGFVTNTLFICSISILLGIFMVGGL